MQRYEVARIMFAAPASGSGKTTVVCAVLRALIAKGYKTASFKCGPDYIDPMFHRACVGTERSCNLDLFLSDEETVRRLLVENTRCADIAVLEGAMGYYDGLGGFSEQASAYAVAYATQTPCVLVVDCRGSALSVAAKVKGFTDFRPDSNIVAVLLNRCSPMLYPRLKHAIEQECGVAVAGYLPAMPDCAFESRHLGLVCAQEVDGLREKLDMLGAQAAQTVDLPLLLRLARSTLSIGYKACDFETNTRPVRIAIARDKAFGFYYAEDLALLEQLGAQLVPFSPLHDAVLPENIGGLLLGGGYPELYARALSENHSMRHAVQTAVAAGLPTIAECGGFLYLHRTLEDADGENYPMAGVLDAHGYKANRLQRFGYATLVAHEDNLLCQAGEMLPAHAFHYWDSSEKGKSFTVTKPIVNTTWDCIHAGQSLYAGFHHLYLSGSPKVAKRFLAAARRWQEEKSNEA